MAPDSNISLRWFLTSSTIGGEIHLNHSLKGVSSVTYMVCSVEWVQPNSARSNENMSWYSARSRQAASANLGAHESRPLKSSSSNNLPCLCLTVSLGAWGAGQVSFSTCELSGFGGSGTGNMDTALATGVLPKSLRVGGVVPHHFNCLLATLPQFSVCILHGKAWWQGAILYMQSLHHYVNVLSQICLHCPHRYYMGGKRFQYFCSLGVY